jgi:putative hemolysin
VARHLVALAAVLLLAGCGSGDEPVHDGSPGSPGLANPASQFCVDQGGRVEIVDVEEGQVGICVLPDGTRVEEWEYYREQAPSPSPS